VVFRVLKLGAPRSVEATSSDRFDETFPAASLVRLDFPARGDMPDVQLRWYDGGLKPPTPDELGGREELDKEGLMFVGDRGTILCGFTGENPRLIPEAKMKAFQPPPKTLPRSPGNEREWLDACRGGRTPPGANFEFSGGVTEALLLGNVALRLPGKRLEWDAPGFRVTNVPEANALLHYTYRSGWEI
jgi:hypothetical protein